MANQRSYAAYAVEDVEDAKRGAPAASLEPWAVARGLVPLGSALPGAFAVLLPRWSDYIANLAWGELGPGRFGYLAHELDEVGLDGKADPSMPGGYHSLRVHGKGGLFRSDVLDLFRKQKPDEPFAAESIWLPSTAVGVRIPEATTLGPATIRTADRFPPLGNPKLDDAGLPGFRIAGDERPDDLRLALGAAARPLAAIGAPYVAMRFDRGVVGVRRNGFVTDPGQLDLLVTVALEIAEALVALAAPALTLQPFDVALAPASPGTWPFGIPERQPHELDALRRLAGEIAMVPEDPIAFHCAHPVCPVPGRAFGVLHGTLPTSTAVGRLGVFDQGRQASGTYRSAVMVPARPGAATPLGGTLHEPSDLYVEVAGGVAYAWPRRRAAGAFEAAATIAKALPTFRETGLADV